MYNYIYKFIYKHTNTYKNRERKTYTTFSIRATIVSHQSNYEITGMTIVSDFTFWEVR